MNRPGQARTLEVFGCSHDVMITGHVDLIRRLPIRERQHLHLLDQFLKEPGNYEGKCLDQGAATRRPAKLINLGNGYATFSLYDDLTRPEISEFLLSKGWRMIGYATSQDNHRTCVMEKWCNIKDL